MTTLHYLLAFIYICSCVSVSAINKRSVYGEQPSSDTDSFPLHLNIKSPNSHLRGIVPHFEEYGETVESVMKAQKRFNIPRPDLYSSEIVKKNDIPHPEDDEGFRMTPFASKKRSKVSHATENAKKRQYVQQYPMMQQQQQQQQYAYNNPYASNLLSSGDMYAQQNAGMLQYQQQPQQAVVQQQVASHVQNLDGAIARPIVTEKACDDQFALCSEYAKNNYCTDFKKQMEVQCRKSCSFCTAEPSQSVAASSKTIDEDVSGSGDFSGSGDQEPSTRRNINSAITGNKRHDILQERTRIPNLGESGDGSGSGSGDTSGSGSGSGEADSSGPIEVAAQRIPQQEFHLPSKKDEQQSDDSSGSGSGEGSGDSQDNYKPVVTAPKVHKKSKKSKIPRRPSTSKLVKRTRIPYKRTHIPYRPSQPIFYPKIDLKEIASSLAHYEEAALELAGEYPKISDSDITEYTRSFIPHPETEEELRANRNRQNIQIAKIITAERAKKSNIPQFLKVTGDVKKKEETEAGADSLDSVQQRFIIPGVEPTLNDFYAETGKLNPFEKKGSKNFKKSRIEGFKPNYDPYEYLRNMPAGASMEPIVDPHKRASIPSDHSYPVFLMKVSPAEEAKYVADKADRRGTIRHYNAEGVQINEAKYQQMLHGGHPEMEKAVRAQLTARSNAPRRPAALPQFPDFTIASKKSATPSFPQVPQPQPAAFEQQQQQQAFDPNFAQLQQNAMQQSSLFPYNQQFQYEQQPGTNDLRNKMFNAFFEVKSNSSPDEGSGMGSGDGLSARSVM